MTTVNGDPAQTPIGPDCPECGTPAEFLVGDESAFCGNDDCRILTWDPTMTLAEMAAEGVHEIDLRAGDPEDDGDRDPAGVSLP